MKYANYSTPNLLMRAAFSVAFILALAILHGCAENPPPCVPTRTAAIVADCRLQYRKAGCQTDPDALCPELVRACDAQITSLSDYEVCTP